MACHATIEPVEGPRTTFLREADAGLIAENMAAFANTEGGAIVVGVDADGLAGPERLAKDDIERCLNLADNLYNPPVVVDGCDEVLVAAAGGQDNQAAADGGSGEANATAKAQPIAAFLIRVPRSTELHALADGRVLIRSGKVNRPLGGQEILRLASAKNTGDFETEAVPGASTEDFSREIIDEYLEKRAERTKRVYSGEMNRLLAEIGAINGQRPTHRLWLAALQRLSAALAAAEQRRLCPLCRHDPARRARLGRLYAPRRNHWFNPASYRGNLESCLERNGD